MSVEEIQINRPQRPGGGYELEELPPRPDGESRFHLATGPGGASPLDPELCLVNAYEALVQRRVDELTAPAPELKSVSLKRIGQLAADPEKYVLVDDVEEVRGQTTVDGIADRGKMGPKSKDSPAATLDEFALGARGWRDGPPLSDVQLWEIGRQVAEQYQLEGDLLRRFNKAIATAVCARAGLTNVHLLTF